MVLLYFYILTGWVHHKFGSYRLSIRLSVMLSSVCSLFLIQGNLILFLPCVSMCKFQMLCNLLHYLTLLKMFITVSSNLLTFSFFFPYFFFPSSLTNFGRICVYGFRNILYVHFTYTYIAVYRFHVPACNCLEAGSSLLTLLTNVMNMIEDTDET